MEMAYNTRFNINAMTADSKVNQALDCKVAREASFTRKSSVTVQAENIFINALENNCVQGVVPSLSPDNPKPPQRFINSVKKDAQASITLRELERSLEHVENLKTDYSLNIYQYWHTLLHTLNNQVNRSLTDKLLVSLFFK